MRCLIIGASGFIGSHLRRYLAADDVIEVACCDRKTLDIRQQAQVSEYIEAQRPDVIVNIAGVSSPASDDVSNLYDVNAFGHLNLIKVAAALSHKPAVILASSAQLYGPGVPNKAKEHTPLNPVSHYGLSKLLAEKYSELFANGALTVTARLYNAIGCGQSDQFLISKIVTAFREQRKCLELGSLEIERDFIDVRDLCEMWRLVIVSKNPPRIVNFSNGETATLRAVIERLVALTGHRPIIKSNSSNFRKNDISYQCGDNSVIRGLGYMRRYSLDDTLLWMLRR